MVVESPRWLADRKGMVAAEAALRALRVADADVDGTLADIAAQVAAAERMEFARNKKVSAQAQPCLAPPVVNWLVVPRAIETSVHLLFCSHLILLVRW